jgi:hypothetical protein
MDFVTVGWDVVEEMCKQGFEGEEEGKARQQATGDGFGRVSGPKFER